MAGGASPQAVTEGSVSFLCSAQIREIHTKWEQTSEWLLNVRIGEGELGSTEGLRDSADGDGTKAKEVLYY